MAKKRLQKKPKVQIILLGILGVLIIAYLAVAAFFHYHFFPNTSLNGVDVSGKECAAAEKALQQEIDTYSLQVKARGQEQKEEIAGLDIHLTPRFDNQVQDQLNSQNIFTWVTALFRKQNYEIETVVDFDTNALQAEIRKLNCMKPGSQKRPVDAYVSDYGENGYEIIPEQPGSTIDQNAFLKAAKDAVRTMENELDLDQANCYVLPNLTTESTQLINLADKLNQYAGVTITYDVGDKTEVLDGSTIHQWLKVSGSLVTIDEEAVAEYVDSLASSYNTVFRGHTLKTAYGNTITIKEGDYGWKVDKEGEKEQILKDIKSGQSVSRELVYSQRANSHGDNDYGDTYVEINLAKQHLFFYKNGSLLIDTDFVSGNQSKRYDTPVGVYGITYKERNATLKGENYATPVDYWMPFCNNVGMHDADWRSSFGGKIYKTNGSHGCVNLPPSAARTIFENIEEGDPVLVYKYPEEEYGTPPPVTPPAAPSSDAPGVTALINNIGAVSLANEAAVAQARLSYNALPEDQKAQVPNYDVLCAAEAQLDVLRAQQPQPPQ